jgi:hypothetical protein
MLAVDKTLFMAVIPANTDSLDTFGRSIMKCLPLILTLSLPCPVWAQVCNSTISPNTPTTRFILDNAKGTALDTKTGLTWIRCALGQTWSSATKTCAGTASIHTWQDALNKAEGTVYAGFSDWRLPNVKELSSIVERRCDSPSINSAIFPRTPYDGVGFWSGSQSYLYDHYSWSVLFIQGTAHWVQQPIDKSYVRLVRGRN